MNPIIKIAYDMVCNEGQVDISMVELSKRADVSRRSLYRLFNDKLDLLLELYIVIYEELMHEVKKLNDEQVKGKKGYNKTIISIQNMISVFLSNKNKIKFIIYYDSLDNKSEIQIKKQLMTYKRIDFTIMYLRTGHLDGSIKKSLNPYDASCFILESILGLITRFMYFNNGKMNGYIKEKYIYEMIKMFQIYLKP